MSTLSLRRLRHWCSSHSSPMNAMRRSSDDHKLDLDLMISI